MGARKQHSVAESGAAALCPYAVLTVGGPARTPGCHRREGRARRHASYSLGGLPEGEAGHPAAGIALRVAHAAAAQAAWQGGQLVPGEIACTREGRWQRVAYGANERGAVGATLVVADARLRLRGTR